MPVPLVSGLSLFVFCEWMEGLALLALFLLLIDVRLDVLCDELDGSLCVALLVLERLGLEESLDGHCLSLLEDIDDVLVVLADESLEPEYVRRSLLLSLLLLLVYEDAELGYLDIAYLLNFCVLAEIAYQLNEISFVHNLNFLNVNTYFTCNTTACKDKVCNGQGMPNLFSPFRAQGNFLDRGATAPQKV